MIRRCQIIRASSGAWIAAACLFTAAVPAWGATPLGTGFTYQGKLDESGSPVNGTADFVVSLWDDPAAGNQIGSPVVVNEVTVTGGLFTVELNAGGEFGADAFNGDARWLEISLRSPAGSGAFTPLLPRQPITVAPYALFALDSAGAGGLGDGHSLDAADGDPIDALFVDNDGKVGIATATPSGLLSLGTWNIGNAGPTTPFNPGAPPGAVDVPAQLTLSGALNAGANAEGIKLLIEGYDNDNTLHSFPIVARDENAQIDFFLRARGAQGGSSLAYFQGKVGIGTMGPDTPLHVVGSDNDGTNAVVKLASDSGNSVMLLDGNEIDCTTGALLLNNNSPGDIWLATGGGNVGIGTTTPQTALHVAGSENDGTTAALTIESSTNRMLLDGNEIDVTAGGTLSLNRNGTGNIILANGGGDVGIGASPSGNRLFVLDTATGPNHYSDTYVTLMRNANTDGSVRQGLLWLEFQAGLAGHANNGNWIQFVEGGHAAGRIDNNSNGFAVFTSGASDYAEALDCMDPNEEIQDGDVVGVFGGKISRQTDGADWVMAITGNAAVVGNQTFDDDSARRRETVSFVGQVPVRVRGLVAVGDYVVASGRNDGTAIAVSPLEISPEQSRLIVGRAWGASQERGVKHINTVVGLPEAHATTAALMRTVRDLSGQVAELREQVQSLRSASAVDITPASIRTSNRQLTDKDVELATMRAQIQAKDAEIAGLRRSDANLAERMSRLEALVTGKPSEQVLKSNASSASVTAAGSRQGS